jgi:hypothetical protein
MLVPRGSVWEIIVNYPQVTQIYRPHIYYIFISY